MKNFLAILAMFFVFAVSIPESVNANSGGESRESYGSKRFKDKKNRKGVRRSRVRSNRRYFGDNRRYDQPAYNGYTPYRRPSVYRRHRNLINIGIGAGSGALIGGLIGGKKGALIGAGVGAGAGAAYTYGINPKNRRRRY